MHEPSAEMAVLRQLLDEVGCRFADGQPVPLAEDREGSYALLLAGGLVAGCLEHARAFVTLAETGRAGSLPLCVRAVVEHAGDLLMLVEAKDGPRTSGAAAVIHAAIDAKEASGSRSLPVSMSIDATLNALKEDNPKAYAMGSKGLNSWHGIARKTVTKRLFDRMYDAKSTGDLHLYKVLCWRVHPVMPFDAHIVQLEPGEYIFRENPQIPDAPAFYAALLYKAVSLAVSMYDTLLMELTQPAAPSAPATIPAR